MANKILKYVDGESPLTRTETPMHTAFTAEKHDPWEKVYIVVVNPHDCYPTETRFSYKTLQDAENDTQLRKYGGRIEVTTYGELEKVFF